MLPPDDALQGPGWEYDLPGDKKQRNRNKNLLRIMQGLPIATCQRMEHTLRTRGKVASAEFVRHVNLQFGKLLDILELPRSTTLSQTVAEANRAIQILRSGRIRRIDVETPLSSTVIRLLP